MALVPKIILGIYVTAILSVIITQVVSYIINRNKWD